MKKYKKIVYFFVLEKLKAGNLIRIDSRKLWTLVDLNLNQFVQGYFIIILFFDYVNMIITAISLTYILDL